MPDADVLDALIRRFPHWAYLSNLFAWIFMSLTAPVMAVMSSANVLLLKKHDGVSVLCVFLGP